MGTSHRKSGVKSMVGRLRSGLATLFDLPDGYEVLLGNGGSTVFWDIATLGLIRERSQHLVFGEFSSKFAEASAAAPFLGPPSVIKADPGTRPQATAEDGIDAYCLTHNETSTGVSIDIARPPGTTATGDGPADGLVLVDATSGAGGLRVDASQFDTYYFAPQKSFASDGGLWIALCSPAAVARIAEVKAGGRWIPASLDLTIALDNSRQDQTYNTPALATLFLFVHQLEWMLEGGGLEFAAGRCDASARHLYGWAEASVFCSPFVAKPDDRSAVVATVDFTDEIDAEIVEKILRANGILDCHPYRKLGRNQLRVAMFPAIDPSDIEALTACIDHVVAHLA